jgi:anti-anti-sigma factor
MRMGMEERLGQLVLSTEGYGSLRILRLEGELESANASEFSRALREHSERAGDLVLDLGGLQFMDSGGVRAILSASSSARCHMTVVGMRPRVARVVKLAGCAGRGPFS